jgi:hypothetical protein
MDDFKYRWKDEVAPELTDDFKWRFAMDALKPKMQIEGPSVGSLLYAMNPKTSELGLKQMDSELNQQLAANANFDKRGDAAMKFMENRVAEDIANKQFADKMALENIKARNVDAGHVNSLMSNYVQALNTGNADAISLLENQIRQTLPNAEQILAQGKETAALSKIQDENAWKLQSRIPDKFKNVGERNQLITDVETSIKNGDISKKTGYDIISKARQTPDWATINSNTRTQAQINAGASRGVVKTEKQLIDDEYKRLKKLYPTMSDKEAQIRAEKNVGARK